MCFALPIRSPETNGRKQFAVIVARVDLEHSLYSLLLERTGMGKTGETLIVNTDAMALLEIDIPDDLPEIKCRSQQIQQVLMNLLTNARDALNERYPDYDPDKIMAVTVRSFERDGRNWLRTTVEDRGTGIHDKIRERLFDPFFTTKDRTKGTGLGLAISQGIFQDHCGELSLECERDRYTRFHLDLPIS